jgi:hypothetical protein
MKLIRFLALTAVGIVAASFIWTNYFPRFFTSNPITSEERSADSAFPVVIRIKGGMLEVASVTNKRYFSGSTDPEFFGYPLSMCRETAGWYASYKITYRVRLGEKWQVRYDNNRIIARVPELEPSLPVAIDTNSLAKGGTDKCWIMSDLGTKDRVLRRISADLRKQAEDPKTKFFARESAKKTIREFLRTWAFNQRDYPNVAADSDIRVIFPGE